MKAARVLRFGPPNVIGSAVLPLFLLCPGPFEMGAEELRVLEQAPRKNQDSMSDRAIKDHIESLGERYE
jgi:hypothetical protein